MEPFSAQRFRHRRADTLAESWARQSWPGRILRAFLGITFVYAGIQKFADRGFFHAGSPTYIGTQLQEFARGSPIAPLLRIAAAVPLLTGAFVALAETATGLATLLGVAPIVWGAVGFTISLVLWLSATWHVHPYFLGSDSMYAVAWAAYAAGLIETRASLVRERSMHGSRRQRAGAGHIDLGRREFLRGAVIGGGALLLAGVAAAFGRSSRAEAVGGLPSASALSPSSSKIGRQHKTHAAPSAAQTTPAREVQGTPIVALDKLPVGDAVGFSDASGNPSVLLRLGQQDVVAYSRVCTHAGCLVDFDRANEILMCPCHGAEFDPKQGAQPLAGPAPVALPSVKVAIDGSTGMVVAEQ
jgi:thiosulfate dehydrogenase [quinone] large subunit